MVQELKDVQAETLLICGCEDMICGIGIAERTIQDIRKTQLIVYNSCGHFPWIEQKEQTMFDIRKFIEKQKD